MDDAGHPSLLVVAYHGRMDPQYFSIIQIETQQLQQLGDRSSVLQIKEITEEEEKYLLRLKRGREPQARQQIRWLLTPPTSSTEDLYLVPNWGGAGCYKPPTVKPLEGYKFNMGTGMCEPIPSPLSSELEGHVVNLGGRIYFLGYVWERVYRSVFQCYDPDKKSWKALEPFPHSSARLGRIVATVVLGNTIVFNLNYFDIWAYDVIKNKWYRVGLEDELCYSIEGAAVVVGDTIYAFSSKKFKLVLAISTKKKPNDGDLVLKRASKNLVPGMVPIHPDTRKTTKHLVHLGKDNFCLVQSCKHFDFNGCQAIKLTYIRLKGEKSVIMSESLYEVKTLHTGQVDKEFDVLICFALPKGATTAFKEGKIFNLEPSPEVVENEEDEDNDSAQTNIIGGQLGEWNRTQAVGSSSFGQNILKNYGGLKSQISGLANDMEIIKNRLENISKDKESLEKKKDRIKNEMMEAKERLDLFAEKYNKNPGRSRRIKLRD